MIKDITFGQYFKTDSIIHRLDPRLKTVLLITFVVMLFICKSFLTLGIFAVLTLTVIFLSKVPISIYLKNLKVIIPIIILTSVLNLFYTKDGLQIILFANVSIYTGGIHKAIFMALRILILIVVSSILTYTTTPNEITDAIERLLSPLKYAKLENAVHTVAMMMTIALRFIPTLIDETDKIMNAQKARGADLESGSIVRRIKALIPILIPLLISFVRRAYDLAEAMECRSYNGGKGRTRMKQLKLNRADYISLCITTLIFASIIVLDILF